MEPSVDTELTFALAFFAGLAGAGHCWSMCGGFAGGLFLAGRGECGGKCGSECGGNRAGKFGWFPHLAYHGGRVMAYTLIGAVAATMGRAVILTGGAGRVQGGLYIAAGCLVVLAGARVAGGSLARWRETAGNRIWQREVSRAAITPSISRPIAPLRRFLWPLAGFLNGFMPCALVFSLALKASSAPSVATGAAWLFAFGLGTVPAMALATALAHGLGRVSLGWLRTSAGLLVIAMGLQAVWAGSKFLNVMLHL